VAVNTRGEPVSIDARELLTQARWVRRLAQSLVRDASIAEDLVQETWLAALEGAPSEEGRLRPWLARVVRNFARQSRRGEANRTRREHVSARSERSPSASETAERLESQRVLVESLESLDEPYRTTVTLRYLEGLSAAQIARKQGIPAGTVRWRLKQGLDQLRARLDKRFGGERRSWALAFLPLLRRPPLAQIAAGTGAAVVEGLTIMSTGTKIAIGVAVLAVSGGVWFASSRSGSLSNALAESHAKAEAVILSGKPEEAKADEVLKSREGEGRESAGAPAVSAGPPAPEVAIGRVEARFVDPDSHPLSGISLECRVGKLFQAQSGADGKCSLDIDLIRMGVERQIKLVARGSNRATNFSRAMLAEGKTTWLGDVVLQPGGAIAGVVLGPDGNPFAGAQVWVTQPDLTVDEEVARKHGPEHRDWPQATSAADGSFQVDGVPAALVRAWAGSEGMRWTLSAPIEIRASEVDRGIQLRFEPLAASDRIEGSVLAPDGTPVAGAEVFCMWHSAGTSSGFSVRSGKDGRFRVLVDHPVSHDFNVADPKARWPSFSRDGVAPGTLDLELKFSEPRWFDLEVREPGGTAVEQYQVFLHDGHGNELPGVPTDKAHPSGKTRIMLPHTSFSMQILARGFAPMRHGRIDPETIASPWVCTLVPVPTIHGRVTAAGAPFPGARVVLHEMAGSDDFVERDGFPSRLIDEDVDSTVTKADGTFQLDQSVGTRFAILCDADGLARAEVSPIELQAPDSKPLEIALTAGGSIEGRVLPAAGHEAAGTLVAITRYDGRTITQRVGPDGKFSFAHLTPGKWRVKRIARESGGGGSARGGGGGGRVQEFPWDCTVVEGEITRFDLDLSRDLPCTLAGDVTVNGKPASSWMATLRPDKQGYAWSGDLPGGAADSGGRLRIEVPEPGPYKISLRPPAEGANGIEFVCKLEIRGGENPWNVALSTGSVSGKDKNPDPRSSLSYIWERGDWSFAAKGSVDAEGRFRFPIVPSGVGTLWRSIQVDANTTAPGGSRSVDVPAEGDVEIESP
jgi:RNA polymerase sigma-70 factor (ECF subfamily)